MSLKIMTYNILDGGVGREELILGVMKKVQSDIIIFQEVTNPNVVQNFSDVLDMDYFFAQGNSKRHLALLSRFPIVSRRSYHPLPPIRTTILEAIIEYKPDISIRLFGIHLVAFPLFFLEWWRTWEITVALREVTKYQSTPILLAGDFNSLSPKDRIKRESLPLLLKILYAIQGEKIFHQTITKTLSAGLTDCYRFLHAENGFTLPPPDPNTRLDYIFANKWLKGYLSKCYVVTEPPEAHNASDHYPVVAEFQI